MPKYPVDTRSPESFLPPGSTEFEVLREFLRFPLTSTEAIFERFQELPGASFHGLGRERVLYIEGTRPVESGRCLLLAHADTVWDVYWDRAGVYPEDDIPFVEENGIIRSADPDRGIGADDRAGLAILWLLRDLGHSLMVTDLEEHGRLGSTRLRKQEPEILAQINRDHAFAIQFDRRNSGDFKCYGVGTAAFRTYLNETTGYTEPDFSSFTDICTLCDPLDGDEMMCGVNMSIGYYDEHTENEQLVIAEWLQTLNLARRWLAESPLPIHRR